MFAWAPPWERAYNPLSFGILDVYVLPALAAQGIAGPFWSQLFLLENAARYHWCQFSVILSAQREIAPREIL